jgi:hypothetical protein
LGWVFVIRNEHFAGSDKKGKDVVMPAAAADAKQLAYLEPSLRLQFSIPPHLAKRNNEIKKYTLAAA